MAALSENLRLPPPEQANCWLARLEGFLSPAQGAHIRRFRQPEQKCLHLLARLIAWQVFGNSLVLDMDANGRPLLRKSPEKSLSFSYTGNHAFCACHMAEKNASLIATDSVSLPNIMEKARQMRYWFLKFPLSPENARMIGELKPVEIIKLWLLHECFIKLYGFDKTFASLGELLPFARDSRQNPKTRHFFHARFAAVKSFLLCISATENIFPKNAPIIIQPCSISM